MTMLGAGGRTQRFRFDRFTLSDLLACAAELQEIGAGADSMEEAAERVVAYFYERFVRPGTNDPANVLVRFYRTSPCERLDSELQRIVAGANPARSDWTGVQCLTLLATIGHEDAWRDRRRSEGHRVIAFEDEASLDSLPMMAGLLRDLGISPTEVISPDPAAIEQREARDYRVFHIADALGSAVIPAQEDFVVPYGVASVLGFGGVLPDGSVFSVILFSQEKISEEVASMFRAVALTVKLAVLPFVGRSIFRDGEDGHFPQPAIDVARSEGVALRLLLSVRAETIRGLALDLEAALEAEHASTQELAVSAALARAMLDASLDAIVNMNHEGVITEFNAVAERVFGHTREDVIGRELGNVIVPEEMREQHRAGLARYLATGEGPVLGQRVELTALRADGTTIPVELAISRAEVEGPAQFIGYIRDITARHAAQAAVLEGRDRLEAMVHTLQQSLLPPTLPEIAGVDLGAAYRAATQGTEVGGDFYDVFETAPNDWALVLGDVCGKGAEAAAVTALTRYTARAAAMRARRPTSVLRQLNEALYRDATDRFCTVVYGRLRISPAKGASLVLGSGGHPPALLLRPRVGVSEISPPGRLLGVFPEWQGKESRVDLWPGDVVVFYSDGLTESRRDGDDLGVEGLSSILKAAEGLSPQAMADFVIGEVVAFQTAGNPDDLAVLVMQVKPAS
ncbi:MAG TPA: SpoIIE family protein phosphatase [Acidimicrobiales bacterium]|nr:SpoIIE family protein phosphatase [Acidimicrobiales bacterium]